MAFARFKAEKKGPSKEEVLGVIHWLTGYDEKSLQEQIDNQVDFETFFVRAHGSTRTYPKSRA
jgi:hypothetical protein